jgi:Ca2+-binding EF-hand superfamily protein
MKSTIGKALTIALATTSAAIAFAGDEEHKKGSIEAEMRIMDANEDGKISASEHAAGAQQMFQGMDGNQDNRVTAVEMDGAHKPLKAQDASHGEHGSKMSREMSSAEKIKKIDADGDGVLTAKEHADGSKKMFTKMDANKDGALTAAEIKSGHEKMMTAEDR